MSEAGRIVRVDPAAAIPGGEVVIECTDFNTGLLGSCRAWFGATSGALVGASPRRVLVIVPDVQTDSRTNTEVVLENSQGRTNTARVAVGSTLAEDLHLVANPAFDPESGALYVTRSGSRGQRMPVSLFRIDSEGEVNGLSGEIVNPTGMAFDSDGQMFVTSRMDGTVYQVTPFNEVVPFARDLGVATGLAFDRQGRMYVGDRTGTIYRVNKIGEATEWAHLEPSVSAYHLAFGPDNSLYVTGPTVASFDAVMRIDETGDVEPFYRGVGRPQGLAFDREGHLYVAASLRGRRGIVRIESDGSDAEMAVAGMNVVGLAFSPVGDMVVATNEAVYRVPFGAHGTLLG